MKRFSLSAFFLGIGMGMIFSFFFISSRKPNTDPSIAIKGIPDEIVVQRAKEIGLIDPSEGIHKDTIVK